MSALQNIIDTLSYLEQTDCPVANRFAPGLYAREMTIPAGTIVVGAVHRVENMVILSKGVAQLNQGVDAEIIEAPWVGRCYPGTQNIVMAVTECVWTNFYANPDDCQDIDVLIPRYYEADASDLMGGDTNVQLLKSRERKHMLESVKLFGFIDNDSACIAQYNGDLFDHEEDYCNIFLAASPIHGEGVFARVTMQAGDTIAPMRVDKRRAIAGRKTNHLSRPNAYAVLVGGGDDGDDDDDGDIVMRASHTILAGEEITVDYAQVLALTFDKIEVAICQAG